MSESDEDDDDDEDEDDEDDSEEDVEDEDGEVDLPATKLKYSKLFAFMFSIFYLLFFRKHRSIPEGILLPNAWVQARASEHCSN